MKFIDKLKRFWRNNLLKNYKKISASIGGLFASILSFFTFKLVIPAFPFYEMLIMAIYTFVLTLTHICFGTESGLTKEVKKILKEDPEIKKAFKELVFIKNGRKQKNRRNVE